MFQREQSQVLLPRNSDMVQRVEECDSGEVYLVDTYMFETPGYLGSYILDSEKKAIIDTGLSTGVNHIFDALSELGIPKNEVEYIVVSHVHLDHAGGAGFLAEKCKNATVVCHEKGVEYLSNPKKLERLVESVSESLGSIADSYGTAKIIDKERFEIVSGGEKIDLGEREIEIIHTPGHAPHQICLYDEKDGFLFSADEAGMYIGGKLLPTTPPPNFEFEKNLRSLERLRGYDADTVLYPHFGARKGAMEALEEYSDILEEWVDDVSEVNEKHDDINSMVAELTNSWGSPTILTDVKGVLEYLDGETD